MKYYGGVDSNTIFLSCQASLHETLLPCENTDISRKVSAIYWFAVGSGSDTFMRRESNVNIINFK